MVDAKVATDIRPLLLKAIIVGSSRPYPRYQPSFSALYDDRIKAMSHGISGDKKRIIKFANTFTFSKRYDNFKRQQLKV